MIVTKSGDVRIIMINLKTEVEEINQVRRKISVEVDSEEVAKRIDKAYNQLSKKAKVKGFRPGKTPRKILEQYYSKQVLSDVRSDLIRDSFPKALEENKLFPLGEPAIEDINIGSDNSFVYSIFMEVKPEFEIKDYMGVSVDKETLNVSEEMVDKALEKIRESHAALTPINEDRGIKEQDHVVISYEGYWNGKPIKNIKGQDFLVHVGSGNFYKEVESGIIGLKKGEKKDIEATFNKDFYDTRLAGRTVNFHVAISDIKEAELPELDADFARSFGDDFKSLEDLRKKVKEEITAQEEQRIESELKKSVIKKIADTVTFQFPEVLVENEIENAINSMKQRFSQSGLTMESAGISESKMREELRKPSEERIKQDLVLDKIARLEGITVEENDIGESLKDLSEKTGTDAAVLRQYYETNNLMDHLQAQILAEKTLNFLVEGAIINSNKETLNET